MKSILPVVKNFSEGGFGHGWCGMRPLGQSPSPIRLFFLPCFFVRLQAGLFVLSSYFLRAFCSVHSAPRNSVGGRGFLLHFMCSAMWKGKKYELWHFLFVSILMTGQVIVTNLKACGRRDLENTLFITSSSSPLRSSPTVGTFPTVQFGETPVLFKPQMK